MMRNIGRRVLALTLSTAVVATMAIVASAAPAAAQQTIGFPEFGGPADPAPPEPAEFTVRGMTPAMYRAEQEGTDFWMDRLLTRAGPDPAGTQLMTRGRALYMYQHDPDVIGFGGDVAYWDVIDGRDGYAVTVGDGGYDEIPAERVQMPSHWRGTYTNGTDIEVGVTKFVTDNNVAVTNLAITNTGSEPRTVPVEVSSPYATTVAGGELTDVVDAHNALTLLFPRLAGDGLRPAGGRLTGSVTVGPDETVQTKVTMGFVTREIAESAGEYEWYRDATPSEAFARHVRDYNRWWAENLPYLDVPDPAIKKFLYYRWWLMRFNYLDANIPGNDFQFPTSIEGVLGYNNAISLTVPMLIDELKYFRNPLYAYGPWLSAGEGSRNGRYWDNPGEPANWNDSLLHYTTDAAWRAYQVHGGQPEILRNLARYGEMDIRDLLEFHNPEGSDPYLLWFCCTYLNGNDADNTSFDYFGRGNDRTETAYVYADALATAEAYELIGEDAKAAELREVAGNVQEAILGRLWDDESRLFLHRDAQTGELIPWKEINNYYPFTVGLVPNEQPYLDALRLFEDPAQYPIFPFYTANQADKAAAAAAGSPGSNNFSQINAMVQFRLLSSVLRNYDTQALDAQWYKKLLYWAAWAHYIGGDTDWPDANEFWFNWNEENQTFGRSGIHHTLLGSSVWTVIEDVMGLRPRTDEKLELWPIDIEWDHFAVTDINYRGRDLAIVWDDPADGQAHYAGVPEGYSAYLDGERVFTVDRLTHLVWDPDTGTVSLPDGDGTVLYHQAARGVSAPDEVRLTGPRVVDMFQTAGVDLAPSRPGPWANLATAATPSASYVDPATETAAYPATTLAGAVDGFTINMPFWGAAGSGEARDWYQLDFGRPRTFDEVKLYFFNDRETLGVPNTRTATETGRYREPALYTVQVWRPGTGWVDVRSQVKDPPYPRSNYNRVRFRPTTAEKVRVLMTHRDGYGTGLKEIQVFRSFDRPPPRPVNQPPQVVLRRDPDHQVVGQARLEAIVHDDALPGGTLDVAWEVVSGPGLALFDGADTHSPVVWFAENGEYVVELTATDGELTTSERVSITVDGIGTGRTNLAPRATATCTNTSPWETCDAISLASDGSTPPQYGTWPTNGDQWVQLEWDAPVRVDSADMWFFQDVPPGANGGVQAPASWNIQYWDGGSWVDVSNPEGFGTELNQFNAASFDPVTTTALRANLVARDGQAEAEGVGVRRWRVYAEQPEAVAPVAVSTPVGQLPELPATVTLVFAGGAELPAGVLWEPVAPEQVARPGTFEVRGLVDGAPLLATATVTVTADP